MIAAAPPIVNIELAIGRVRPFGGQGTARSTCIAVQSFLESGVIDDRIITDEKTAFPFWCSVRPGSVPSELAQMLRL